MKLTTERRPALPEAGRGGVPAVLLVFAIVLASSLPALAQTEPTRSQGAGRPYRGLFGGVQTDPNRYRSLDLSLSFLGGYDDNVAAGISGGGGGVGDPRFGENGGVASASASLIYRKARNENWVSAAGRTGFRYYQSLGELNAADYSGTFGFSARPSPRMQVAASQDVSYQPFFSLATVPVFAQAPSGALPVMTLDYSFLQRPSLNYNTSAGVTYDIARRLHLSAEYVFRGFDFTGSSDEGHLRQHGARIGLSRDITRRFAFGGRYAYNHGDGAYQGPDVLTRIHGGEVTLDYRRTLRTRRQVSVGFSAGYDRQQTEISTSPVGPRNDRRVTAGARLSIDVGRTWTVGGDYRRGLRHLPGVSQPIFSNDAQVRFAGLVGRRVDLSITGQYSKGEAGLSVGGFDSLSGITQARWAVNRLTAVTANYVYYRYEFPPGVLLPAGFDRRFNRHAFRVGVDVWLPLFR